MIYPAVEHGCRMKGQLIGGGDVRFWPMVVRSVDITLGHWLRYRLILQ